MTRIKLGGELIKILSMFQGVTRTQVRDCIEGTERTIFVVEEGQISRAIGKGAENVRKLEKRLNRKIKIVEFNSVVTKFVRNLIYPAKAEGISEDGKVIIITPADTVSRGRIIGRGAQNLREMESITKRYFEIDEIKVV